LAIDKTNEDKDELIEKAKTIQRIIYQMTKDLKKVK
jgi:hypothetical protein